MKKCFECGNKDNLHNHHVVPVVLGGTKTVILCSKCHGLVHNRTFLNHKTLQLIGIKNAKERGIKFGRPKALGDKDLKDFIGDYIFHNISTNDLAKKYNISQPTARRLVKKLKEDLDI